MSIATPKPQTIRPSKSGLKEIVLIADAANNTVTVSARNLTTALHELDVAIGEVQSRIIRLRGHDALVVRWRDIDERFRQTLNASKLAASSMTVFISEYKNVILGSLVSGKVTIGGLKTEITSLSRNVERRGRELTSDRKQSTMQDLCKDLVNLVSDTQSDLSRKAATVEKEASGLLSRLTQLSGELHKWVSKRSKLDWSLIEKLDFGPFVCAPVAVMLNTDAVREASVSALMSDKITSSEPVAQENVHITSASTSSSGPLTTHAATFSDGDAQGTAQSLQALNKTEQLNPDMALRTDLIAETYTLLLLELKGILTMLDQPTAIADNELFNQRVTAVSSLYGSLIQMFDFYSKQVLFTDRANVDRKPPFPSTRIRTLRKPFAWLLCGGGLLSRR